MKYSQRIHLACLLFAASLFLGACSDASPADEDICPEGTVRDETGECVEQEPACTDESCERGVCDPSEGCVNADDCAGDASRCLAGFFCADDDTCQPDLCEQNDVECTRGVCDRTSGECVDAQSCDASEQCVDGKRCLSGECTDEAMLCGEEGCEEAFVCDYDEQSQSAECAEPTQCETSRECFDGRVCAGELCVSAPVCEPDAFEPNEAADEAVDFAIASRNDAVDATLCADDRDVYRLEVPSLDGSTMRRNIRVVAEFPRREVGLGPLTVTLRGPDDEVAASETSGDEGVVDIDYRLPIAAEGTYEIAVELASEDAPGGLHYRLAAQLQPRGLDEVCVDAPEIAIGETVEGSTERVATTLLRSRCTDDESHFTNVYAFEVDEASDVTVRLAADRPEDFLVGVRTDCRRLDSESACAIGWQPDFSSANDHVELDAGLLEPGRYFVLVQNPDAAGAGPYELQISADAVDCSPAQNSCDDLSRERTCSPDSGSFSTATCERGCAPHTGSCRPVLADTCESAPIIFESTTVDIDWANLSDDYQMPDGGCLPVIGGTTQTDGPDAVYEVSVPPDHALEAALRVSDARYASLYLLEDCLAPAERCVRGANEDYVEAEELTYINDSDSPQTFLLVADSDARLGGEAELDIAIEPVICHAGQERCRDGDLKRCSPTRTDWTSVEECQWGCSNAECLPRPGQTCGNPIALTAGQTYSGEFADFDDRVPSVIAACDALPASRHAHTGSDAFFSIDLDAGDLLSAELDTDTSWPTMYVFDECRPDPSPQCLWTARGSTSLEFYAPETKTYFLALDHTSTIATDPFDLTVEVQPGAALCQPGGSYCDPTSGEWVRCDETGQRELARLACPNGCSPHGCEGPQSPNDTCDSAYPVSGSARFVQDLGPFTDAFQGSSACGVARNEVRGPDAVYEIDLAADEMLFASVEAVTHADPSLYLVEDCANPEGTCIAGQAASSDASEIEHLATSAETLYLVVDLDDRFSYAEQVVVDIDIRPVGCQHGQTRCTANPVGLDFCSPQGVWEPYICEGGCTSGACDTPTGGICQDAIVVNAGQTVTGDFAGANNVELGGRAGACAFHGTYATSAPDTFYRIDLLQGDLLEVDLQTDYQQTNVHILKDCSELDTCQPGTSYRAEADGPVWVMVDSDIDNPNTSHTYSLTFDVTSGVSCTPSEWSCVDDTTVGLCDAAGSAYETTYGCPGSCARGGCEPALHQADECSTAPNIGDGIVVYADREDLTDDVSFGSQSSAPDLVYEVSVADDEILHVSAAGASIRLIDDCADPQGSELSPDGTGDFHPTDHELYWTPDQARTVKMVVEALDSYYAARPIRLMAEKLPVECTDGERSCSPSGDAVRHCEPFGVWRETPCQTTCSNGRCDAPTGEYCEDPIELSAGMSVAGDFSDLNDDSSLSGVCSLSRGTDAFYEIELAQGDMLQARVLGPPSASLAVMNGCGSDKSCLASTGSSSDLDYLAEQAGTYYLIVDEGLNWGARGDEYVLEVEVVQGRICQPDLRECDPQTNVARKCNAEGTGYEQSYTCALGCDGDLCALHQTINDTCDSALTIDSSTTFIDDFSRYNNDYQTLQACTDDNLGGAESIYAVELDANEMLNVDLEVLGGTGVYPRLFVTAACANQPSTCLGLGTGDRVSAELTYRARRQETVYLVVDARNSYDAGFRLTIDISTAECPAGNVACLDADTLQVCERGRYVERDCPGGCANAQCNAPPNDVCGGATTVPRDGDFHTYPVDLAESYTDQVNIGTASTSCAARYTDGPDAIYRIDAFAGDKLTAYWPPGGLDLRVWLSEDCANAAQECVLDSHSGFLEKTFSADATHWLIVDTDAPYNGEPFNLDVRLAPQICQPGEAFCDASTGMISYCNEQGTAYKDYACQGGCDDTTSPPTCAQPRGEQCVDAVDATGGGSFTVDLSRFDNTFNPGNSNCTSSSSDGGDAIYRVDLQAGQTVEASTQLPEDASGSLYIIDDCHTTDAMSACLAGGRAYWQVPVTVSHTATADETVYVVLDSVESSTGSEEWPLDITVQ